MCKFIEDFVEDCHVDVDIDYAAYADYNPEDAKKRIQEKKYRAVIIDPNADFPDDRNPTISYMRLVREQNIPIIVSTLLSEEELTKRFGVRKGVDYDEYAVKRIHIDVVVALKRVMKML